MRKLIITLAAAAALAATAGPALAQPPDPCHAPAHDRPVTSDRPSRRPGCSPKRGSPAPALAPARPTRPLPVGWRPAADMPGIFPDPFDTTAASLKRTRAVPGQ